MSGPITTNATDASTPGASDPRWTVADGATPGAQVDAPGSGCAATICGSACVDLNTDVQSCGACANDCTALPHVDPHKVQCVGGSCVVSGACDPGWAQCGADLGCKTSLSTSTDCGACVAACAEPTPACAPSSGGGFQCVSGCGDARPTRCNGSCVDLSSDAANCGACGVACAPSQVCHEGKCRCGSDKMFCASSASCVEHCSSCAGATLTCKALHACVAQCSTGCGGEHCK